MTVIIDDSGLIDRGIQNMLILQLKYHYNITISKSFRLNAFLKSCDFLNIRTIFLIKVKSWKY